MANKLLAVVFSFLILAQGYGVRRAAGTWLFPAALFNLFWFFMLFFPLVILWSVPIDPCGAGFVFVCLISFSASALVFPWHKAFDTEAKVQPSLDLDYGFLKKALYLLSAATLISMLLNSLAQGTTVHDLIFDLIATAAYYRDLLNDGKLDVNVWQRIGEVLVYVVATLGGLIISTFQAKWSRARVIMISFVPSVFVALAQSSKWAMFCCLAFFYAGILTYRISQREFVLLKRGSLKKIFIFVPLLIAIVTASFISRGLQDTNLQDPEDINFLKQHLTMQFASYSCAHVYAFSDWFAYTLGRQSQVHYQTDSVGYGAMTFAPIARALGDKRTFEDEDYWYEDILRGNIYTMFQGLIKDFGVSGCLLFMFGFGLACHAAFYSLLVGRFPALSATMFIFCIVFMYSSYARSLFSWSSLYFTFVLVLVLLHWARNASSHHAVGRIQATPDLTRPTPGVAL